MKSYLLFLSLVGCSMSAEEWSTKMATKYCDACSPDDELSSCVESTVPFILEQLSYQCPYDEDAASACLSYMDEALSSSYDSGYGNDIEDFECRIRENFVSYTCPVLCYQ
jgi:hypothetical protein